MCAVLSHSAVSDSLQPHELWPTRLLQRSDFPGKNTGVSCHFLFLGLFPTQGSNPGFLQFLIWQVDSLPLNHLGSHTQIVALNKYREYARMQVRAAG